MPIETTSELTPEPRHGCTPLARAAGYDEGNLNWLAAFEVEPAGDVMALRVWKTEELTPLQAQVGAVGCRAWCGEGGRHRDAGTQRRVGRQSW